MRELDKKASRQRNDVRSAGSAGVAPGKSTLTSQLPYIQATAAPDRDVDRPSQGDATKVPSPASSLPRLDLGKSAAPSPPGDAAPMPGGEDHARADADSDAPPAEQYVIPFDRAPKSVPGEQIIFGATYSHAMPNSFKLVYTSAGGHFGSQGSGVTTKTFPGLNARNVDWFIDAHWNGTTSVTMKLDLQKTDGTIVATTNWTFSKKSYQPTMTRSKKAKANATTQPCTDTR